MLRDLMVCLVADLDKIDPKTNLPYTVSKTYMRTFMSEHKLKPRATAAVDPARARQATAAVRDGWFQSLEEFVGQLHANGKVSACPATRRTPAMRASTPPWLVCI